MDHRIDSTVQIIGCTQKPDQITAAAARISTTTGDCLSIFTHSVDTQKNQALIQKVLASGHRTIIEHIYFNLAFQNVSAYAEQFMLEFRLASFTVKSRRYVDFSNMGFVVPAFIGQNGSPLPDAAKLEARYREHMSFLFQEYEAFCEAGIPKEDARFLLPYCYRSNFYCTVNARELYHILSSMLHGKGKDHTEIHALGMQLYNQAADLCPYIFRPLADETDGTEQKYEKLAQLLQNTTHDPIQAPRTGGISVELLSYPKNPEYAAAKACLCAYTNIATEKIDRMLENRELTEQVLSAILADRRPRELEQLSYTFRINGISLACVTHLTRHRMQSILIPPFYDVCDCERYMIPETVKADPAQKQRYQNAYRKTKELYDLLTSYGLHKQETAYLYLSGSVIDLTTTINARELLVFLSLRTCNRAQWETRNVAMLILNRLREVSPALFCHFGPSCFVTGRCPEGKKTCGQFHEVQKQFSAPN